MYGNLSLVVIILFFNLPLSLEPNRSLDKTTPNFGMFQCYGVDWLAAKLCMMAQMKINAYSSRGNGSSTIQNIVCTTVKLHHKI